MKPLLILSIVLMCCGCANLSKFSAHTVLPDQPIVLNRSDTSKSILSIDARVTPTGKVDEGSVFNFPHYQLGLLYDRDFIKDCFVSINANGSMESGQFLGSAAAQFGYRTTFQNLGMRATLSLGMTNEKYSASIIDKSGPKTDTINESASPINMVVGVSWLLHSNVQNWPVQVGVMINASHIHCFAYGDNLDTADVGLNTIGLKPFMTVSLSKTTYLTLSINNNFVNISNSDFFWVNTTPNVFHFRYVPYFGLSILKEI